MANTFQPDGWGLIPLWKTSGLHFSVSPGTPQSLYQRSSIRIGKTINSRKMLRICQSAAKKGRLKSDSQVEQIREITKTLQGNKGDFELRLII